MATNQTTNVNYFDCERVKLFLMAVDPWHGYSNEAERANWDIFDDFKLKMICTKIFQRFKTLKYFSASFEYLCYRSTAIRNSFTLSVRGSSLYVIIWRLQTSDSDKEGPRAIRVKPHREEYKKNNSVYIVLQCQCIHYYTIQVVYIFYSTLYKIILITFAKFCFYHSLCFWIGVSMHGCIWQYFGK